MLKAYAMALAVSTTAPIADNTKESVDVSKNDNKDTKVLVVDTNNSGPKIRSKKKKFRWQLL